MSQSPSSNIGLIAVLSAVLIVVLIVILAFIGSLVQSETVNPIQTFVSPIEAIEVDIVDPALALAQLGGLSPSDIIDQAIQQARPGTALATLVYHPSAEDQDTAGDLLLLGNRFTRQNDLARAKLVYELASALAALSPDLSDTARADILLQAGLGLISIDAPVQAKLCLDQTFLIATESNYLQAAYRTTVLTRLNEAYRALGLREEARQALELSAVPADLKELPALPLVLPKGQAVFLPDEIEAVTLQRWQLAQTVVRYLVELGGKTRPEALLALKEALLTEDRLKIQFFNTNLASEPLLSHKVDIVQAKINWLSIKYRIARQGFGLSLVTEWESQEAQIEAELKASYELLYRFYSDLIVAIPDIADLDRATEEAIRRQILAGVLGHYPDYPSEQLRTTLLQTSARLIDTQAGASLRTGYVSIGGVIYYTLVDE